MTYRAVLAACLVVSTVACGEGRDGDSCTGQADCAADLACAGPDDPVVCGIPPREACASDAECGGARCHAIADPCSPDGVGSECRAACVGDGGCDLGFRCAAGACVARSCDVEAVCAPRQVCDPARVDSAGPVHARHHGCFEVACTDDGPCGDRVCVNGTCQDHAGVCTTPMLVP